MKDKEKQIEELDFETLKNHKEISDLANLLYSKQDEFNLSNPYEVGYVIINILGYRKIDKDSVVLTEREHEIAMIHQYDVGFAFGYKKGSKETAEKFYKKVRKLLKKVDIIVDGDEGLVGYEESAVDKGLTEIAKQYGVDIEK